MDQIVDRAQELRPDAVLIAGNHDSAHRLQYASSFLEKHQIYVDEMPLGMSDAIQSTAGRVRLIRYLSMRGLALRMTSQEAKRSRTFRSLRAAGSRVEWSK